MSKNPPIDPTDSSSHQNLRDQQREKALLNRLWRMADASNSAHSQQQRPHSPVSEAERLDHDRRSLENQHLAEHLRQKRLYAKALLWILGIQLAFMNIVVFMAGWGELQFDEWLFSLYIAGTLGECFGLALIVTKFLFPSSGQLHPSPQQT